jgi:hypothetical protein
MRPITLRGKITRVFEKQPIKQGDGQIQEAVLTVASPVDDFGEKKWADNEYLLKVFNGHVDRVRIDDFLMKNVEARVYLNGKVKIVDENDRFSLHSLVVADIKPIES